MPKHKPASKPLTFHLPSEGDISPEVAVQYIRRALEALSPGFTTLSGRVRTPERFVKYLQEFMKPYSVTEVLGPLFEGPRPAHGMPGMVVQKNIPFRMCCEHHLLPAFGHA